MNWERCHHLLPQTLGSAADDGHSGDEGDGVGEEDEWSDAEAQPEAEGGDEDDTVAQHQEGHGQPQVLQQGFLRLLHLREGGR